MRYLLTSLLCVLTLSLTAQEAGCTYQQADNFSPTAIVDDGTCVFFGGNQDDCPNTFDGDGDGNVAITDLLGLLAVFGDTDQDADGVWDSLDDCIDFAACNYFADPSEVCQYLDVIGVCGGSCTEDDDSDLICDDVDDCVGYYDECDVCNGSGIPEGYCDCFGSVLDECDTCDDDPSNDCVQDCNGEWGGTAVLDECDTCDSDPTNDCVQDCNQEWGGTAELDECGTCDSDLTNDCVQDCEGHWGGTAALDECGVCDEDVDNDCVQDCNEEWGGTALLDECGVCDSDPSNDCVQDCNGVWGGTSVLDECGVCDGPGPTEIVIESITILYDSLYAEQIDEWWVYEVGADTVFNYTCAHSCGEDINHEGYDYSTVQIGDQCWFSENCRYLPEVSPSSEGSETEPYYYVNDYQGTDLAAAQSTENYAAYGVLYNWPAVMTEDICPSGWHIPTDEEFTQLTDFLGGASVAGLAIRSTSGWSSGCNGSNSSGFTGLPGGSRSSCCFGGSPAYWWSASESEYNSQSLNRWLDLCIQNVGIDYFYSEASDRNYGYSARCIRCEADEDGDGVCDNTDECVDNTACNFEAVPSEPCEYTSCAGCMDSSSCNYDSTATLDDGSCEGDSDGDGICDSQDNCDGVEDECGVCNGPGPTELVIDTITLLYDSIYSEAISEWWVFETGADTTYTYVCFNDLGCTDEAACNYDILATVNDGTCLSLDVLGVCGGDCLGDADEDGICDDVDYCVDVVCNGNDQDCDGICDQSDTTGCMDPTACDYNPYAYNDGGCDYSTCEGCMISLACNYDPLATIPCGGCCDFFSCIVFGCIDPTACNYDPDANYQDGTCEYASCFEPAEFSECGDDIYYEGYNYSTVQIGEQCWFSENCRYLPEVSYYSHSSMTDPYYYVYGYSGTDLEVAKTSQWYVAYGVLYNWPAVMTEAICPSEWHIPTDEEFTELTDFLGGASVVGYAMKSTSGWSQGGNGSNSSGWSGLPGGYCYSGGNGGFGDRSNLGYWWTATESYPNTSLSWLRILNYQAVHVHSQSYPKYNGYSARCVRDN